jgi:hypothetical protein
VFIFCWSVERSDEVLFNILYIFMFRRAMTHINHLYPHAARYAYQLLSVRYMIGVPSLHSPPLPHRHTKVLCVTEECYGANSPSQDGHYAAQRVEGMAISDGDAPVLNGVTYKTVRGSPNAFK